MAASNPPSRSGPGIERLVSAGGVVYRRTDGGIEVALCGRRETSLWALPKGTPNPGESIEETALREAGEETGLEVALEAPLGSVSYWFQRDGVRCFKTVHFHLMRAVGGSVDRHDPEFDVVQWFPVQEALRRMTYPNEAEIVRKAMERVMGDAQA